MIIEVKENMMTMSCQIKNTDEEREIIKRTKWKF